MPNMTFNRFSVCMYTDVYVQHPVLNYTELCSFAVAKQFVMTFDLSVSTP